MRLIFAQSIFLGVSFYDITCNCDITGSPFLENMASLKKLGLNRKLKHERNVNFLHQISIINKLNYSNLLDILMCLFENRIHEYLNINPFKNEESDKMRVDSAHIQGACGG